MHRKKANNCTPSCRRQIKAENEWPHFPLSIKSEFDGKRFSTSFTRNHIDVFGSHISLTTFSSLTSRRVGCREDATTVCLCVGECKCNVISHKTLNWFLFYEFFLSRFSFSLLQLSLSCLIEFFHVFFFYSFSFTLKALPCTVASTFRERYESAHTKCNVEMESERER